MRGRHSGGRLGPAAVCGTSVTAAGLQAQIFGPSGNPW